MSVMDKRKIHDAARLTEDLNLTADVVVVGTGAGGGFTAEVLTQAGLKVVMVEEGGYHTAKTFSMNEGKSMPMLYQEAGAQRTKDKGIVVLQGRCVGGGTTVNWTTCLKPPAQTLAHWRDVYGLAAMNEAELESHMKHVYERLNINPWTDVPPNANNSLLGKGCEKLGYHHARVARNVNGCGNTGLCGNGCPINAKQSQMVTTIPAALDAGAQIVTHARVMQVMHDGKRASGVEGIALDSHGVHATGKKFVVKARHVVLAAGAIRSPGLLMRSKVLDPSGQVGKRTFLHPVTAVFGRFEEAVNGFHGAPQTVYSEQFMWPGGKAASGQLGFKVETIGMTPITAAALGDKTLGAEHAAIMKGLPHLQCIDALCRDGFNDFETGGTVELAGDGRAIVDYPVTPFLVEGMRKAQQHLMEIQFAAGAKQVMPWHIDMPKLNNYADAKAWLATADLGPQKLTKGSAHVMGGCMMGTSDKTGVVNTDGRHFVLENLSVHDASIFPTSVGLNPQVTIYATAVRNSRTLAAALTKS